MCWILKETRRICWILRKSINTILTVLYSTEASDRKKKIMIEKIILSKQMSILPTKISISLTQSEKNLFLSFFLYLFICLFIYLFILFIFLFFHLFIYLFICLFIYLNIILCWKKKLKIKVSVIMYIHLYLKQKDNTMHVNFIRRKLPFYWHRLRNVYFTSKFFMPR